MPNIREGLWESTVDTDGSGKLQKIKQCFGDHESVKSLFEQNKKMMQGTCGTMNVVATGNKYTSNVSCDLGISKLSIKSVVQGDFQKEYTVTSHTSFNPPMMGQKGNVTTAKASYLGDCPSGIKPGDVVMADGKKINMNEMAEKSAEFSKQNKEALDSIKDIDPKMMQQMQEMMKSMGK